MKCMHIPFPLGEMICNTAHFPSKNPPPVLHIKGELEGKEIEFDAVVTLVHLCDDERGIQVSPLNGEFFDKGFISHTNEILIH